MSGGLKTLGVIGTGAMLAIGLSSSLPSEPITNTPVSTIAPSTIETTPVTKPVTKTPVVVEAVSEPAPKSTKDETISVSPVPATKTTPASKPDTPVDNCHPSYSGCLKVNAGDYDCASGSGNGPNYTSAVQVYGSDPFDLDRDNDGWGCE